MFNLFGFSETARINRVIAKNGGMTDKQFLEKEIEKWKKSPQHISALIGDKYYHGNQDILRRKRTVIGEGGAVTEVENLPNNRIVNNQYAKMVDQKVNYLLGKPLTFNTKNTAYADALKEVLGKRFHRLLKTVGTDSLNGAIGWIYIYYNAAGELSFKRFPAYEILPFWHDAEHTILDGFARVYVVETYEGTQEKRIEKVEIYSPKGVQRFTLQNNTLIADDLKVTPYLVTTDDDISAWNWSKIPLIPWKYNSEEIALIRRVKSLQDGINEITSDFENNMQEDARNTILVLVNYDGTDLGEFRRNLSQYGVVKVKTVDGASGDLKTLTVEVNADNYKAILDIFKKALIDNARGYDVSDLRSMGSPNQMNIKSIYNDIDLDANGMETEYQAAFEELLWFVNMHLANTGKGNFEGEQVDIIFNRDTVVVESEVISDAKNSVGLISNRTIVAQHPWVDDVEEELKRIEEEKQAAMDEYTKTFMSNQKDSGGGVNAEQQ